MTNRTKPPTQPTQGPDAPSPDAQPLVGFRTNEEWDALLAYVNGLVAEMEQLPEDDPTRERVFDLLQGIDAIHREALSRLVRLFKDGVLEQVVTDPAIRTLMELYDLLPQDPACVTVPDFIKGPMAQAGDPEILPSGVRDHVPIPHWVPAPPEAAGLGDGETAVADIGTASRC